MRVLMIQAFEADNDDRMLADVAAAHLQQQGHDVERFDLVESGFATVMSSAERAAYETDQPLLTDETRVAAAAVDRAEALLFVYPTTTFTVPAVVKGWLERVLVLGVAFEFDASGKVKPKLRTIRRLGVITTTRHSRRTIRRHRDLGRRTIMWALRLNCHRFCRRTFVSVPATTGNTGASKARVSRALDRW